MTFCKKKNIFSLIENLTLTDFGGKYSDFIEKEKKKGTINNIDKNIDELKSRMKSFITYQLGNTLVSSGIGCGYYDETGMEDKKGINKKINDYLFEKCFNPEENQDNYEHFLDYLLINFANVFAAGDRGYKPHINEFVKVLNKEHLINYWKKNKDEIKKLNYENKNKVVFQGNYSASYQEDLTNIYQVLDKLLKDEDEEDRVEKE